MRVSLEVFGIPAEAAERLRRSVYESYERFLHRNGAARPSTTLSLKGGTCPLTGAGYLNVLVQSPYPLELSALQQFADAVYASHPRRDDDVVRNNRSVRIEDSPAEAPLEGLAEADLRDDEISCWICGRFDGEEYYDHETKTPALLDVRLEEPGPVPLCSVCLRLLQHRKLIE